MDRLVVLAATAAIVLAGCLSQSADDPAAADVEDDASTGNATVQAAPPIVRPLDLADVWIESPARLRVAWEEALVGVHVHSNTSFRIGGYASGWSESEGNLLLFFPQGALETPPSPCGTVPGSVNFDLPASGLTNHTILGEYEAGSYTLLGGTSGERGSSGYVNLSFSDPEAGGDPLAGEDPTYIEFEPPPSNWTVSYVEPEIEETESPYAAGMNASLEGSGAALVFAGFWGNVAVNHGGTSLHSRLAPAGATTPCHEVTEERPDALAAVVISNSAMVAGHPVFVNDSVPLEWGVAYETANGRLGNAFGAAWVVDIGDPVPPAQDAGS